MAYNILPTPDRLQKTVEAVRARGVTITLVDTKESALAHLQALIPAGASVMTGASISLQQTGFEALLMGGNHPWKVPESRDPGGEGSRQDVGPPQAGYPG